MTPAEEYALRSAYDAAMAELSDHGAAWLEARAAGHGGRAEALSTAIAEASRLTRGYERKARKAGVKL